ncbi:DUF3789 domain-containing protein [Ruminococcus sp.]|uniref:DUF3789 domain-containing protein n=1 Tax=Ruminococcus sp. TaxID=41978 RepID=UPI003890874A
MSKAYQHPDFFNRKEYTMFGFLIGLFIGAFIGVAVMCCCFVASKADNEIEQIENKQSDYKEDS